MMKILILTFLFIESFVGCTHSKSDPPLENAVNKQNFELAKKLLLAGADPNERDIRGGSPLEYAVYNDDTLMIGILLSYGADIHSRYRALGVSLLHISESRNRFKAAKFLIEHGLSPDIPDSTGSSPLISAVFSENIPMISLLLKFGANPNFIVSHKYTPLSVAFFKHNSSSSQMQKSLDQIQTHDSAGEMRRYLSLQIIQLLLKSGATTNSPFPLEKGDTYLHQASESCDTSVVQLLLQYGANRDVKNEEGMTPLDVAKKNGCKEVEELLAK